MGRGIAWVRRMVAGAVAAVLLYIAGISALIGLTTFEGRAMWPLLVLISIAFGVAGASLGSYSCRRRSPT